MQLTLIALVENKPGVLFKVTHLFRSRNFNIDSISVGVTANPEFSRMTITTIGDEKHIQQIVKQLDKMIDTIEVRRLDVNNSVYRELVMFKIKVNKPENIISLASEHKPITSDTVTSDGLSDSSHVSSVDVK